MAADAAERDHAIWAYALGYFACYAPYSALTKAMAQGLLPGTKGGVSGFAILPVSTMASLAGMFAFLTAMGWWKRASHRTVFGVSVPCPTRWTFLSGLCSAAIIGTTTLAYTWTSVSIVFMMLLMRGGVLVIAPIVDAVSGRCVRWFSWVALLLSLGALLCAFARPSSYALTPVAAAGVGLYLGAYLVRLRFMSRLAKSDDPGLSVRYFVEEQMVATPAIVLALGAGALVGRGAEMRALREGFTSLWASAALLALVAVGVLSQGTGIFGGLILLDRRENTFCVPVNRASSVLAGVVATWALAVMFGLPGLPASEMVGAGLILAAIAVLAMPDAIGRRAGRRIGVQDAEARR